MRLFARRSARMSGGWASVPIPHILPVRRVMPFIEILSVVSIATGPALPWRGIADRVP